MSDGHHELRMNELINEIELRPSRQNAITVKKRSDESETDLSIDYAKFNFVQGPYALLPRLLVMAAVPFSGCRGATILSFLQNFAPNINKHIPPLWKQRIPLLQGLNLTKIWKSVCCLSKIDNAVQYVSM